MGFDAACNKSAWSSNEKRHEQPTAIDGGTGYTSAIDAKPPKLQRSVVRLLGKLGSQASTTGRRRIRIQALSTINGTLPSFGPGWLRKVDRFLFFLSAREASAGRTNALKCSTMHDDHDNYDAVHISYCVQGIIRARLRPFSSRYTVYRSQVLTRPIIA